MKPIIFSEHAKERRKQRGLTEMQILEVIERPEYVKTTLDGRKIAVKEVQRRFVTVVYVEMENYIKVITVF